jgi:predicted nucleotide-binding protein
MGSRFTGPDRDKRLAAEMLKQRLVEGDQNVAEELVARGRPRSFAQGKTLIKQGGTDDCVYFILSGEAKVMFNDREVDVRTPGESVGEMAAINRSEPRSASVVAKEPVYALCVSAEEFNAVADAHWRVWRAAAQELAKWLRQKSRFHKKPNAKARVFVGSSVEGLAVARAIQSDLSPHDATVRVWTNRVFGPGGVTVDDLLEQVDQADFAAFVFGKDDKIASRGKDYAAPRDNVVFELGLFMSRLGRKRCFIVKEKKAHIKIPSDLLGITPLTYTDEPGTTLADQIATLCNDLRDAITKHGSL